MAAWWSNKSKTTKQDGRKIQPSKFKLEARSDKLGVQKTIDNFFKNTLSTKTETVHSLKTTPSLHPQDTQSQAEESSEHPFTTYPGATQDKLEDRPAATQKNNLDFIQNQSSSSSQGSNKVRKAEIPMDANKAKHLTPKSTRGISRSTTMNKSGVHMKTQAIRNRMNPNHQGTQSESPNEFFGSRLLPKQAGTFRIGFQNINKLPEQKNSIRSRNAIQHIADAQYDILMMSEIGLFHPKLSPDNQWSERTRNILQESKAWFAYNSLEPELTDVVQYGGVGILATDEALHRIIKHSRDPKGLGRWVSVSVQGKEGHVVTFFSVYRPVVNNTGASSVYQQHIRHLRPNEEPRQCLLDDLKAAIDVSLAAGEHVVLGIDANEDISRNGPVKTLMNKLGLQEAILEFHSDKQPPETYRRNLSKYPIDGIFTTPSIAISDAGYLPYDEGIPSDHRGLWIDVSFSIAFGQRNPPLQRNSPRRLKTSDPRLVSKYNRRLSTIYMRLNLPKKLRKIQEQADREGWSSKLEDKYNKIHATSIEARMKVETSIRKLHMGAIPWSPRLQKYRDIIALWEMLVRRRKKLKVSMTRIRRYAKKTGLSSRLNVSLHEAEMLLDMAYKEYKVACKQADNWRTDHQDALLEARAQKNNSTMERELKLSIQHERQRAQSRNINRARDKLGKGKVTKVSYEVPSGELDEDGEPKMILVECTTKQDMEAAIIAENVSRFTQSEDTPPMKSPLIDEMGYFGEKESLQELLRGSYPIPQQLPNYTQEFLRALQQPATAAAKGTTPTSIPRIEHCDAWRKQREGTASEPSGPSFSHYKAAAEDKVLGGFDATIRELPYKYGFSPTSWRKITDISILKKTGVYVVEKMRTIQLMFAEFNMNNKKLGRDVMAWAEACGVLPDDQFGSRKWRRAIMAALNKRLTMDILRQRRLAGALCANDAKSCYDRIVHWIAVAALCRAGLALAPALSMFMTLGLAIHVVSTAYGVSKATYGKHRIPPPQGVGQGNGSGPAVWAVISAVIIAMMYAAGHGAQFLSPLLLQVCSFVCYAFVDDTDLVQTGCSTKSSGEQVAKEMQVAVDRWEGGLRASGGALVPKKSHWYLVDFVWRNLRWEYRRIHEMEAVLTVVDTSGERRVTLQRHEVNHAEETLGVKLSMDGNNKDQVEHLLRKTKEFADHIRVSHLSKTDVWFALERCIMMTLEYCLPAVTLSADDWKVVLAPIMKFVLPKAGIDSSFPRRLVFAPKSYQGLGLMHPWHRQNITHLVTLITESMNRTLTGQLISQSLESTRLEVGLSQFFWNRPYKWFKSVVTPCWISNIWDFASQHNIHLHDPFPVLESFWSQDLFLMDLFSSAFGGEQLRQLNHCRMFLKVSCLSEISTADGRAISFNAWHGFPSCNRWNAYAWPRRPSALPAEWWNLWREALMKFFCSPSRKLKVELGYPICQPHRWRWFYSMSEDRVYHKEGALWRQYARYAISRTTRFQLKPRYQRSPQVSTPPSDLQPVNIYRLRDKEFIRMDGQPLPPIGLAGPTGLDPLTLNHTLVHEWTIMKGSLQEIAMAIQECKCLVVSDGSFKEGHCTAAFTLRCLSTGAQILGVNALPGPIEMSDSFRGELGGTVGALEMIRWISATHGISSGSLTLASDGEGAIKKASSTSRLHHSQASFDLLQKIREQLRKLPINIDWKWVKGHQSGKLSLVARLNKLCDETAKAYWRHMDAQQTWKSSASFLESWQVWLGDDKLTSISLEAVYDWSILFDQDFSPQTYWQAKHQIPPEDFHNVDWEATGRANKSQSSSQQRWLAKFLSGFLGTNQREHFRQASTDPSCPRCDCPCEDARHVVLCQGEGAVDVWRAGLNKLDERLSNMDTMPELQLVMMSRLRSWYAGTTPRQFSISNKHLMQALEGQDRIGWNNFVYGRPHYLWSISQLAFYQSTGSTKSPRRWLQAILKQLWAISWDMWQHRNHVKHKQISHAPSPVLSSLRSQLYRLSLGANEDWLESEQLILRFSDKDVLNWTETELRARIASILAIRRRVKNRVQVALNLARPMRQFMQNWFKFGSGNASH